jgi:hypothetical protein
MFQDRRNGESPIPSDPELYINEQQVHGLIILKKFGWKLICIRRSDSLYPSVILKNSTERRLGLLEGDGILKLSSSISIRNRTRRERLLPEDMTETLLSKFDRFNPDDVKSGRYT